MGKSIHDLRSLVQSELCTVQGIFHMIKFSVSHMELEREIVSYLQMTFLILTLSSLCLSVSSYQVN